MIESGPDFQVAPANASIILLMQSFTDSLLVSSTTRSPIHSS